MFQIYYLIYVVEIISPRIYGNALNVTTLHTVPYAYCVCLLCMSKKDE